MFTRRDFNVAAVSILTTVAVFAFAQTAAKPLMRSGVFNWSSLKVEPTKVGEKRQVFDAPTATLERFESHITTINPGEAPHAPHQHPEEELMILKEGTLEVVQSGQTNRVETGGMIFCASGEMHGLRNVGKVPATYYVVKWYPHDLASLVASSPRPPSVLPADVAADLTEPEVPASLRVPAGNTPLFHAYAIGAQIYHWKVNKTNAASSAWVLQAPSAGLFDKNGVVVGYHSAGPSWESQGGRSAVEGVVLQRSAADANAIPWLLLQATNAVGHDIFERTTYIQRVNTTGGLAPKTPGTEDGQRSRSPYTAEYYFYCAQK